MLRAFGLPPLPLGIAGFIPTASIRDSCLLLVMPGLVPLLSGLALTDTAHGRDSTGFRKVRWNRDSNRRSTPRPSPRHARTCSGHPLPSAPLHGRMDARNKSGHDEGGAFRHDGKRRNRSPLRAPKTPARLHPMAKPDSRGLVPGIHFRRLPRTAAWIPGTSPGMTEEPVEGGRSGGGRRIRRGFRSTTAGISRRPPPAVASVGSGSGAMTGCWLPCVCLRSFRYARRPIPEALYQRPRLGTHVFFSSCPDLFRA